MNTSQAIAPVSPKGTARLSRGVHALYDLLVKPRLSDEDQVRREFILNIILLTIVLLVTILDISILIAKIQGIEDGGFGFGIFSFFVLVFTSLLVLSRTGYVRLATYLLLGMYFLGTTYGIYAWGIELPLGVLSYAVIIIMASILLSSGAGFGAALITSFGMMTIGFLQTQGYSTPDIAWRSEPMTFKDTIEQSFVFVSVGIISWLSNREIRHSLKRARASELELKKERDMLESRVEERTRELKTAQLEKATQLYRFAEFGRLASGIYHDLLNPLTAVSLSVERIRDNMENKSSAEAHEHIEQAVRASRRMDTFLHAVRKQLATESTQTLFRPADEIREAIDMLSHKANRAHVEMRTDIDASLELYGSATKFFQIVINLISNAIDAYHEYKPSGRVEITLTKKESSIQCIVEDDGKGIPEEHMSSIFEPFFTTKNNTTGIGLGLSTTKQIVEQDFGGTIVVESGTHRGSRFSISIPVHHGSDH